jgi:hypothetical protein
MKIPKGTLVYPSVKGKRVDPGVATGAVSSCRLEGCCGLRVSTVWPDGKRTRPCTKGMVMHSDGAWEII